MLFRSCSGVDRRQARAARDAEPIAHRVASRARGADRTFLRPARWIEGKSRRLGPIHRPARPESVACRVAWKRYDPQPGWRRGRHDASRRGQAAPAILTKRQVLRVVAPAAVADHVPLGKPSNTDCVKHIHDLPPKREPGGAGAPGGPPVTARGPHRSAPAARNPPRGPPGKAPRWAYRAGQNPASS